MQFILFDVFFQKNFAVYFNIYLFFDFWSWKTPTQQTYFHLSIPCWKKPDKYQALGQKCILLSMHFSFCVYNVILLPQWFQKYINN